MSDDSHGVAQVGLNFSRVKKYLEDVGVETLWYLERVDGGSVADGALALKSIALSELQVEAYPTTS